MKGSVSSASASASSGASASSASSSKAAARAPLAKPKASSASAGGGEGKKAKKVPEWAQGAKLQESLRGEQMYRDPDEIFGPIEMTCDLQGMFVHASAYVFLVLRQINRLLAMAT